MSCLRRAAASGEELLLVLCLLWWTGGCGLGVWGVFCWLPARARARRALRLLFLLLFVFGFVLVVVGVARAVCMVLAGASVESALGLYRAADLTLVVVVVGCVGICSDRAVGVVSVKRFRLGGTFVDVLVGGRGWACRLACGDGALLSGRSGGRGSLFGGVAHKDGFGVEGGNDSPMIGCSPAFVSIQGSGWLW